ncbi:unnamed protein product [Cercopithifilaria johnstoni]|uniref:Uncharacterized protein n=1 Tax=Cercopithifilaria johnstoni TaxID=2874296 RepID=A0A8J2LZB1_9BILA|nr:unnamed protein product [Cercopithifilaria johnstoni]
MTACSCSPTKRNAAVNSCNDNFASVLRHIRNETQRDLENPLRYQLIPQRYRMKHKGYAVCRLCAEQSHHQSVPLSTNFSLMDYLRENSSECSTKVINNDRYYLTVELGCCLARLTRLIFALTKALKELRFVSGDMYPMLGNDIVSFV